MISVILIHRLTHSDITRNMCMDSPLRSIIATTSELYNAETEWLLKSVYHKYVAAYTSDTSVQSETIITSNEQLIDLFLQALMQVSL